MSINFVINSQLYKDSIIGAYTLFWDSINKLVIAICKTESYELQG